MKKSHPIIPKINQFCPVDNSQSLYELLSQPSSIQVAGLFIFLNLPLVYIPLRLFPQINLFDLNVF